MVEFCPPPITNYSLTVNYLLERYIAFGNQEIKNHHVIRIITYIVISHNAII